MTGAKQKEPQLCKLCPTEFTPRNSRHKFCSDWCRDKWNLTYGQHVTATQYSKISGNWKRYLRRLLYFADRKELTADILLRVLERQRFVCAISGVPLTCQLIKGVITPTNASIDRINAGGPYSEGNVQMVCRVLNSWRGATSVTDFIGWCRKVVEHNKLGGSDGT